MASLPVQMWGFITLDVPEIRHGSQPGGGAFILLPFFTLAYNSTSMPACLTH